MGSRLQQKESVVFNVRMKSEVGAISVWESCLRCQHEAWVTLCSVPDLHPLHTSHDSQVSPSVPTQNHPWVRSTALVNTFNYSFTIQTPTLEGLHPGPHKEHFPHCRNCSLTAGCKTRTTSTWAKIGVHRAAKSSKPSHRISGFPPGISWPQWSCSTWTWALW